MFIYLNAFIYINFVRVKNIFRFFNFAQITFLISSLFFRYSGPAGLPGLKGYRGKSIYKIEF